MRNVVTEKTACEAQIRANMQKAGRSDSEIETAIKNYHKLSSRQEVRIAVLT